MAEEDRSLFGYSTDLGPLADFGELAEPQEGVLPPSPRAERVERAIEIEIGIEATGGPAFDVASVQADIEAEPEEG
jgi:hypothetical protein